MLRAIPHLTILQTYGSSPPFPPFFFFFFRRKSLNPACVYLLFSGLTETSPFCTVTPVNATEQDYGSIGLLLPNLEARLVNEDDKDIEAGKDERGELWIRGTNVM